jgi:toxin ParE1/3/4
VALRLLESADATFDALAEMPGMGGPYATRNVALKTLRCFPVKGFRKYLVFCLMKDDAIEIIRVIHGARNIAAILRREP